MFLGMLTCGGITDYQMYSGLNETATYETLKYQQTTIDDIYASSHTLHDFDWVLPNNWDYHIVLHAMFTNGDMNAGNAIFRDATKIMLKKRVKGTFDWKTIYIRDISTAIQNSLQALNIEYDDYLEPNKKDIEYAYTAVIGGKESDPVLVSTHSFFYGYYIVGQYQEGGDQPHYPCMFNISHQLSLSRPSTTVVSPGSKYPYVINNGQTKYYGGNFSVTFMPHDQDMLPLPEHGATLRNTIDDFLTDGYPKILKTYDGDIYMAAITGDISRENGQHYQNISQSWDWVEVGDPNDCGDLYDYGFINTDIGRNGG